MKLKHALIIGIALAAVSLVAVTGLLGWWLEQPVNPYRTDKQAVVIPKGSSVKAIGTILKDKGLVRSPLVFQFEVWRQGIGKNVQAGSFQLSTDMSTPQLAQALTKGANDVWVTLKEGQRAEEYGEQLTAVLPNFSTTGDDYKKECLAYQGYLFPETYLIPLDYTTAQVCKLLRTQYGNQVTMQMRLDMHQAGHKEEEVMTLASLVEREARTPENMKLVASVLWNRLKLGMPLQVDSTLQFIKGFDAAAKTWWPEALPADKNLKSPYNTYLNAGLPPGPIANPGLNAINAATYPATSDYLYYLSNTDGTKLYFAKTYAEHQANIAKYLQ